MMANAVTDAGL